jgi:hypothetical protein
MSHDILAIGCAAGFGGDRSARGRLSGHARPASASAVAAQYGGRDKLMVRRRERMILRLASGRNFLFRSGVPQLHCALKAPRRQPFPVGREGH